MLSFSSESYWFECADLAQTHRDRWADVPSLMRGVITAQLHRVTAPSCSRYAMATVRGVVGSVLKLDNRTFMLHWEPFANNPVGSDQGRLFLREVL